MKKFINLSWCLLLVLGFASCDIEKDEIRDEPVAIGGYAVLADRSITVFDTNEDLSINFFTAEGVTVESVELLQDGTVIGNAVVSGETATFSSSVFGAFEFEDDDGVIHPTGSFDLRIRTTYSNGKVSEDPFSVSVGKAISLGDNHAERTLDSIAIDSLFYSVSTHAATVDQVTLELKKNKAGTYAYAGVTGLSTSGEDTIPLASTNFDFSTLVVGDTLHYKFTATSGTLTDVAQSYIVIVPAAFDTEHSSALSSDPTASQVNLATGKVSASGDTSGEIAFYEPTLGSPGFQVINSAQLSFVQVANTYWENAEMVTTKRQYEANVASAVTTVTDVTKGEVFVYKVTRNIVDEEGTVTGTETLYGVLQIGDVRVVNDTVTSFDINWKEGK